MPNKTANYLLSDGNSLLRIKKAQFRRQIPALALLLVAFLLSVIFPRARLYTPALILALAAIAWYLFVGACHRFKQRIPLPEPHALVSPIQGKIRYIRSNNEITLIKIGKIMLDGAEIRSPHQDCRLEDGSLTIPTPEGKISFRFNIKRLTWFPQPDFSAGNIIGMLVGNGSCTITLPQAPELRVSEGQPIDAGDTLIDYVQTLSPAARAEAEESVESGDVTSTEP